MIRARLGPLLSLALFAAGCGGTAPARNANPSGSLAAVLLRGRMVMAGAELFSGSVDFNLESDSRKYRLRAAAGQTNIFVVEPGLYRIAPARGAFGKTRPELALNFNGHLYRTPFPRALLRHDSIRVKPGKIVSLGVLEARMEPVPGVRRAEVSAILIDDVQTRRELVTRMIAQMMDPKVPQDIRDNAVAWTRALDQALVDLQEAQDAAPTFKPGPTPP